MDKIIVYGRTESIIEDALKYFSLENIKFLSDVISKSKRRTELLEICNGDYKITSIAQILKFSLIKFDISLKLPKINIEKKIQNNDLNISFPPIKMIDEMINTKILEEIKEYSDDKREASFECKTSIVIPLKDNCKTFSCDSKVRGKLSKMVVGSYGKGIEKIFELDDGRTLAQIEYSERQFLNPIYISLKKILFYIIIESFNNKIDKSNIIFEENATEDVDWKKSSYYKIYENIKSMSKISRVKTYKNVYFYTGIEFKSIRVKVSTEDNKSNEFHILVNEYNNERRKKLINCLRAVYKEKLVCVSEIMEIFPKL